MLVTCVQYVCLDATCKTINIFLRHNKKVLVDGADKKSPVRVVSLIRQKHCARSLLVSCYPTSGQIAKLTDKCFF